MKTIILIPTYNEKENIEALTRAILELNLSQLSGMALEILVVDDNSPDGTGTLCETLAKSEPKLHAMVRKKDRGRGSAGIAGFKEALHLGADFVIEMDADFSHDPKYIPDLLKAAMAGADVVLGSRFVAGGQDADRTNLRKIITKCAGFYVRRVTNLKVRDVSSGYRCFNRQTLLDLNLDHVISTGPSIILEILYKCSVLNKKIVEIPIVFVDRIKGSTKLNWKILLRTLLLVAKFRYLYMSGRLFVSHGAPTHDNPTISKQEHHI